MDNKAFKQLDLIMLNRISWMRCAHLYSFIGVGAVVCTDNKLRRETTMHKNKDTNEHQMMAGLAQAMNKT